MNGPERLKERANPIRFGALKIEWALWILERSGESSQTGLVSRERRLRKVKSVQNYGECYYAGWDQRIEPSTSETRWENEQFGHEGSELSAEYWTAYFCALVSELLQGKGSSSCQMAFGT